MVRSLARARTLSGASVGPPCAATGEGVMAKVVGAAIAALRVLAIFIGSGLLSNSKAERIAVLAMVGCAQVAVIQPHRHLGASEVEVEAGRHLDAVTHRAQLRHDIRRAIPFDRNTDVVVLDAPAWRIAGGLRVLAEI